MERVQSPETFTEEPFTIRAHHLGTIYQAGLVGSELLPSIVLQDSVRFDEDETNLEHTYYTDVFGTTKTDRAKTVQSVEAYLKNFWALDNNTTVTIVTRRKDGICESCVFGEHCDVDLDFSSDREAFQNGWVDGDSKFIARFEWAANKLGLDNDYSKSIEPTERNTGTVLSTVLTTRAEIVKRVITSKQFHTVFVGKQPIENDPGFKQAQKTLRKEEKTAVKALRKQEKNALRAGLKDHKEYRNAVVMDKIAQLRPLLGGLAVYFAAGTMINIGQTYQAAQDSEQVKSRVVARQLVETADDNFEEAAKNGLLFSVSGLVYFGMPHRRKTRARLHDSASKVLDKEQ